MAINLVTEKGNLVAVIEREGLQLETSDILQPVYNQQLPFIQVIILMMESRPERGTFEQGLATAFSPIFQVTLPLASEHLKGQMAFGIRGGPRELGL